MTKTSLVARRLSSNEKVETIATLSRSIVHEFKNYPAAINICAELSESKVKEIKNRVKTASYLINNLHLQIKGIITNEVESKDFRRYSILKNIIEAIKQYLFKPGEQKLITLVSKDKDFEYFGNLILTNHIFYNLIKNSLRAIRNNDSYSNKKTSNRNKITIKLELGTKFNKVIFTDTASGIAKEFLPKIFKLFRTKTISQGGTGISLAFCTMIMKSYSGDIICNSIEGKCTEFILSFPVLDSQ
ncbi:MAG: HAMP domain-containing histidine kinase [Coxiellaceae bacterium]|jgi:signal transduction histidine kinase|nr:HAMP domain-containing histidine kinase [Coxiellaceae bacterium]